MKPMKPTMDDLHRMDPATVISYDGRRPMTVVEVIMHICHGDWDRLPDPKPRQVTPTEQSK
jgi:hypothetical protein